MSADFSRPEHATATALIIFDAVKGFIGGGMSIGRDIEGETAPLFRFKITASHYDEQVTVAIDIPDVEPAHLMGWSDWNVSILERQKLILKVDDQPMPFPTALAFIAIRLGDAQRRWEQRQAVVAA